MKVNFSFDDGRINIGEHSPQCLALGQDIVNVAVEEKITSPEKLKEEVTKIANMAKEDISKTSGILYRHTDKKFSDAMRRKIVDKGLFQSRDFVKPENSHLKLIEILDAEGMPRHVVFGDDGEVNAIFYHDPVLLNDVESSTIEIFVLTSDVTHGVFNDKCGFQKLSLWCYIDAGRRIRCLGRLVFII